MKSNRDFWDSAHRLADRLVPAGRLAAAGASLACGAPSAMGAQLDDFLQAADRGGCIETEVYRTIRAQGPEHTGDILHAALLAMAQRRAQQRAQGCDGDIATQAIAAGADPGHVLQATAAGL
ncbi:MAG: hypothetical protein WBP89_20015 [Sedimenticolaceae bacterium]